MLRLENRFGVDHSAGVMISLARDLTQGVFYRPLFGTLGYGGTRYFPLYFTLNALLLKLGVPVLLAAYLLSFAAMLALLAGTFCLLIRIGVRRGLAAAAIGTLVASVSAQLAVVCPSADGLASALNVWGAVLLISPNLTSRRVLLGAFLFILGWAAKLTACFGLIAAVAWLLMTGARRRAVQLGVATVTGYLLVVGIMLIGSQGRVLRIFAACALGGTGWKRFLNAPLFMEWDAFHHDLGLFLLVFFSIVAVGADLLESPAACIKRFSTLLFASALLLTVLIYGSPGTNVNHLLEVQVASVVVLAHLTTRPPPTQRQIGIYALVLAVLIPAARSMWQTTSQKTFDSPVARNESCFRESVRISKKSDRPVLAENPVISVLAGQVPYVLDPWMMSVVRRRIPQFGDPLLERLQHQAFGAVILLKDPRTDYGRQWYDKQDFGPGFIVALTAHYRLLSVVNEEFVYVPISDHTRAGHGHLE